MSETEQSPRKQIDVVKWLLQAVTYLLLAGILFYGRGFAQSVETIKGDVDKNSNRLTIIESNRYTVEAAKRDNDRQTERINAIEVRAASDSATLNSIQRELNTVSISLSKLIDRLDRQLETRGTKP